MEESGGRVAERRREETGTSFQWRAGFPTDMVWRLADVETMLILTWVRSMMRVCLYLRQHHELLLRTTRHLYSCRHQSPYQGGASSNSTVFNARTSAHPRACTCTVSACAASAIPTNVILVDKNASR